MSAEEAREHRWLRKIFKDVYQNTNQFVAVALTNGYKLTQKEANPDPNASSGTQRFARQAFRGRILDGDVPSPHSFLKDPCNLADAATPAYTTALILQHTEFLVLEDDFKSTFKGAINVNDRVSVYLDPGPPGADFNLERGWAVGIHEGARNSNTRGKKAIDCTSLKDIMANAPAYTPGAAPTAGDCGLSTNDVSLEGPGHTLYLGDSQMAMQLGAALMREGGDGNRIAKSSARPVYWTDDGQPDFKDAEGGDCPQTLGGEVLKSELEKGPTRIIISLGDNGAGGTAALIEKIKSEHPNIEDVEVIWSGKSPPIYGGSTWYTDPNEPNQPQLFLSEYDKGAIVNNTLKAAVEAEGWIFHNPYDFSDPNSYAGQTVDGRQLAGYECYGCDGIHVQADPAAAYAASLDL